MSSVSVMPVESFSVVTVTNPVHSVMQIVALHALMDKFGSAKSAKKLIVAFAGASMKTAARTKQTGLQNQKTWDSHFDSSV